MNEAQTLFTVFFAISWGIVSNVVPRWKPFHFGAMCQWEYRQPFYRLLTAFLMFNIVPWIVCVAALVHLRDVGQLGFRGLLFGAVVPGLVPFGCYRCWQAVIRCCPRTFYAPDGCVPNEPKDLELNDFGCVCDFIFGVLYIASAGLVWAV